MRLELPLPSSDMQIRSVDVQRPDTNALAEAAKQAANSKLFHAGVAIVSSVTDLDETTITDLIPWASLQEIILQAFVMAGVGTKLNDQIRCRFGHVNKLVATKLHDNRTDVLSLPVNRFKGDKYEDSFFVLRPFVGEEAKRNLVTYPGQPAQEVKDQEECVRVIRYDDKLNKEKHEIKIKSITFRHAFAEDMMRVFREVKDPADFQRRLLYALIAGMEFTYRGPEEIESGDWKALLNKFRNLKGGILNFQNDAYYHAVIEGTGHYGRSLFFDAVCEEITCRDEWQQAWNFMYFFVYALQQHSTRKVLGGRTTLAQTNGHHQNGLFEDLPTSTSPKKASTPTS